jgi:hypothetical protein
MWRCWISPDDKLASIQRRGQTGKEFCFKLAHMGASPWRTAESLPCRRGGVPTHPQARAASAMGAVTLSTGRRISNAAPPSGRL